MKFTSFTILMFERSRLKIGLYKNFCDNSSENEILQFLQYQCSKGHTGAHLLLTVHLTSSQSMAACDAANYLVSVIMYSVL